MLENCRFTEAVGTRQMRRVRDPDLREAIHKMRAAALEAIQAGLTALSADSPKKFDAAVEKFRLRYGALVGTVKNFFRNAGPLSECFLRPLVDRVM